MLNMTRLIAHFFSVQKIFLKFFAAGILLVIFSCRSEPYLYDKPGFDEGNSPQKQYRQNPDGPSRVAPDYYYRQQQYPPQGYAPPPQQPYYYQPQQQPYPPQGYGQPYPQGAPGSRFYSNPYAIPPSPQYPQYDTDQYYVPPTSYYNTDSTQGVVKSNGASGAGSAF
jgi:hypothetical protein